MRTARWCAIALLIAPIVDRVLNPGSSDSTVPFFRMPFGGHTIYLNQFFPPSIVDAWIKARPRDFAPAFLECWKIWRERNS